MAVETYINNSIHLFRQHIINGGMNQSIAFFWIPQTISIALIKAKVGKNVVISGTFQIGSYTVDDLRCIENCQVLCDNPNCPAAAGFQIAGIQIGMIVKLPRNSKHLFPHRIGDT